MMLRMMVMTMMMFVMVTKEAGSEINERDANNDKVKPAPGFSNVEYTK